MRRNVRLVVVAASLAFGVAPLVMAQDAKPAAPATQPAGVTGTYTMTVQGMGDDMEMSFKLQQDGDKLTGTFSAFDQDTPIQDGTVSKSGDVSFKVARDFGGQQMVTTYTGKVANGVFKGKSETKISRDFEAKRQ